MSTVKVSFRGGAGGDNIAMLNTACDMADLNGEDSILIANPQWGGKGFPCGAKLVAKGSGVYHEVEVKRIRRWMKQLGVVKK